MDINNIHPNLPSINEIIAEIERDLIEYVQFKSDNNLRRFVSL